MARGSHHTSGGHSGSHHSSGGSRSHSSHSSSHSYSSHYSGHGRSSSGSSSSLSYGEPPAGVVSYNGTWMDGNFFFLNVKDPVVQDRGDKETLKNSFSPFWITFVVWIICGPIYGSNALYEDLIPFFEALPMEDFTFFLVDNAIYYFPMMLMFLAVLIPAIMTVRIKNKRRALCQEVINYYKQLELQKKVDLERQQKINSMELYTECPNCCGPVLYGSLNCEYCGSSLIKEESDKLLG